MKGRLRSHRAKPNCKFKVGEEPQSVTEKMVGSLLLRREVEEDLTGELGEPLSCVDRLSCCCCTVDCQLTHK